MTPPRLYACFDAAGRKNPAHSDLKHYFLLRAWARRGVLAGRFVDVHAQAPRFDPRRDDVRAALAARLRSSDVLLLVLSEHTRASNGWLAWEIEFAARDCNLPLLCAYAGAAAVDARHGLPAWWPPALRALLSAPPRGVHHWHVPFRAAALGGGLDEIASTRRGAGVAAAAAD